MNYLETASEILQKLGKQQEAILMEQLNDLVKRNLLIIESTQPVLAHDQSSDKIVLTQSVKLTLKDKEYIEKLEKENADLKFRLKSIEEFFGSL